MQNTIANILVPFNFSSPAKAGLKYALAFSSQAKTTKITLIYVHKNAEGDHPFSDEVFEQFISEVETSKKIQLDWKVKSGSLAEGVLEEQQQNDYDLIIMGTKGSEDEESHIVTNTAKLVVEADCPVIVVPVSYETFNLEKITLAIGKNELDDHAALKTLLIIARRFDAEIHVLTIYNEDDEDMLKESPNEGTLRYYLDKYYKRTSMAISSHIGDSIIDYDDKEGIDLLAFMPHNHTREHAKSEGRLATFLTMNSHIPILAID